MYSSAMKIPIYIVYNTSIIAIIDVLYIYIIYIITNQVLTLVS